MAISSCDRWRPVRLLAVAVSVAILGACSSGQAPTVSTNPPDAATDWNTVLAEADTEGTLVLRSTIQGIANNELKAAFEAEHPGIEVTIESSLPTDLVQKTDAEHAAGQQRVDVLLQSDRAWHEVHEPGFFAPILGPGVAVADVNLRNGAASDTSGRTLTSQMLYDANTLMVIGYSGLGYSWNKDAVSGKPDFRSLFEDDSYKGRIGIVDPGSTLAIKKTYALWAAQYPDMFARLGRLDPTYYPSGQALAQSMAAGAVDVGFPSIQSVVAQTSNLSFDYDLPAPALPRFGEILSTAPHPNAAQVFIDWIVGRVGQETLIQAGGSLPVVETPGGLALDDVQVFDVSESPELDAAMESINRDLGR